MFDFWTNNVLPLHNHWALAKYTFASDLIEGSKIVAESAMRTALQLLAMIADAYRFTRPEYQSRSLDSIYADPLSDYGKWIEQQRAIDVPWWAIGVESLWGVLTAGVPEYVDAAKEWNETGDATRLRNAAGPYAFAAATYGIGRVVGPKPTELAAAGAANAAEAAARAPRPPTGAPTAPAATAPRSGPKPSPKFRPPTNPPQLPPTQIPPGIRLFSGKPTQQ